jgi:hypothetical protein
MLLLHNVSIRLTRNTPEVEDSMSGNQGYSIQIAGIAKAF